MRREKKGYKVRNHESLKGAEMASVELALGSTLIIMVFIAN